MTRTLSGNILWHFTSGLDIQLSILKNGFYPRLCFEDDIDNELSEMFPMKLTPMVCFCDMKLSSCVNGRHTQDYGEYAIGVSKDWCINNGVSPVQYIPNKKSYNAQGLGLIMGNLHNLIEKNEIEKEKLSNIFAGLHNLLFYTKPLTGANYKNWKRQEEIISFYDEREWRYVPIVIHSDNGLELLSERLKWFIGNASQFFYADDKVNFADERNPENKMSKQEVINKQNDYLAKQPLRSPLEAIEYVLVKKESEIKELKKSLIEDCGIEDLPFRIDSFENLKGNII